MALAIVIGNRRGFKTEKNFEKSPGMSGSNTCPDHDTFRDDGLHEEERVLV